MVNYLIHYRGESGLIRDWVVSDRYLTNALKWIDAKGFSLIGYEII